jgi:hypothetical protein
MEKSEFMQRYWYYYETLVKLSKFSLYEPVTVRKLQAPRGVEQALYKDREKLGINDDFIQLLCRFSAMFLRYQWEESNEKSFKSFTMLTLRYSSDARNAIRGKFLTSGWIDVGGGVKIVSSLRYFDSGGKRALYENILSEEVAHIPDSKLKIKFLCELWDDLAQKGVIIDDSQ